MRSYLVHAAIAALLLSVSAGTVYAAGLHDSLGGGDHFGGDRGGAFSSSRGDHRSGLTFDEGNHDLSGDDLNPQPSPLEPTHPLFDTMQTGSISRSLVAPTVVPNQNRPRLAQLVHELGMANQRIDANRQQGNLTVAEFHRLKSEEAAIRSAAVKTAEQHNGVLPAARYAAYQNDIHSLGNAIHRLSTNSARA